MKKNYFIRGVEERCGLQTFTLLQPTERNGIAGHLPIAAGAETYGTGFYTIWCAIALKLLGEETPIKHI